MAHKVRTKSKPSTWRDHIAKRWRDAPDEVLFALSSEPSNGTESQHPGEQTILAYISGSERAAEIIEAWAFRFPVSVRSL